MGCGRARGSAGGSRSSELGDSPDQCPAAGHSLQGEGGDGFAGFLYGMKPAAFSGAIDSEIFETGSANRFFRRQVFGREQIRLLSIPVAAGGAILVPPFFCGREELQRSRVAVRAGQPGREIAAVAASNLDRAVARSGTAPEANPDSDCSRLGQALD